jgi:hypothetical protein
VFRVVAHLALVRVFDAVDEELKLLASGERRHFGLLIELSGE